MVNQYGDVSTKKNKKRMSPTRKKLTVTVTLKLLNYNETVKNKNQYQSMLFRTAV